MSNSYAYQKVDDDEKNGFRVRHQTPWYRRPSVLWLLPTFLLFNLAMGATSMPRTNVLISLICRKMLAGAHPTESEDASRLLRRHGGGMKMNETMTGDHSSSSIIVGDYNPQCATDDIESAAAMLNLWGNLIAGILGAIVSPLWGKLSDRYGRIKVLAAVASVFLASEILVVLIARFPDVLDLNWVYLTFTLEGFSGSFILIMALASSYAADCTKLEDRNVALGWFHGSMFFGMAAGPAFGGYLGMSEGKSNPLLIFYTALGIRIFAILLLALVPESLSTRTSSPRSLLVQVKEYVRPPSRLAWTERLARINPLHLLRILTPRNAKISKHSQRNLLALACINTILFGAVMGGMNIMMLYSEFRFGWGNKESGIFLSTVNIFRTLATVVVLPLAIKISRKYFGASASDVAYGHGHGHGHSHGSHSGHDPSTTSTSCCENNETGEIEPLDLFFLRSSILSDALGYIFYALSPTGPLFTLSGAVASLGAIGLATSEAAMTKLLPASQTGELLGALGFLQAIARIVAPTVASLVYSATTKSFPQLVFWGIAAGFGVAGGLTWWVRVGKGERDAEADADDLTQELRGEGNAEQLVPLQLRKGGRD